MRELAARRKRVILAALTAAVAVGLSVLAVYWLGTSSRFDIKGFEVEGRNWLPEASMQTRLGVEPPVNVFRYDCDAAERRLEQSPWVKAARVRRVFPNRISVSIEENQPAAVALVGELYLVDADGAPFKRASISEAGALDLLVITGISREAYRRDGAAASARIASALSLSQAWHRDASRPALSEVHIDAIRGFSLIPKAGRPAVRIGDGDLVALEARVALFDTVWSTLTAEQKQDADFIHLDIAPAPSRVAIAFRTDEREKKQHPWAN